MRTVGDAIILATLSVATSFGQPVSGIQPFGSFSGGPFDVVNNANLNVHFEIPIINKAGRGLPFTYVLTYDSSVYYPVSTNGGLAWTPVGGSWGWQAVVSNAAVPTTGYISYKSVAYGASQGPCSSSSRAYTVYSAWQYYDTLGGVHALLDSTGAQFILYSNNGDPNCEEGAVSGVTTADGGFSIASLRFDSTSVALTATNGTGLTVPVIPINGNSVSGVIVADRNGNEVSYNPTNSQFTDTLGTCSLTVSGTSPIALSYINPNGTNANGANNCPTTQGDISSFQIKYKAYTIETKFGCTSPGISEYNSSGTVNLVDTIALPDGTSYSFKYEPTYLGSGGQVTGRLASVTLPTGGTISYAYSSNGTNSITCADGTPSTLLRTTPDSATPWAYVHSESPSWSTTINDPALSPATGQTTLSFQTVVTGTVTRGYEIQRTVTDGLSTLYSSVSTCYNGHAVPCSTTINPNSTITEVAATTTVPDPNGINLLSEVDTLYNGFGLPVTINEYGYGNNAIGTLARQTQISYAALQNGIVGMPSAVTVSDGGGVMQAQTV